MKVLFLNFWHLIDFQMDFLVDLHMGMSYGIIATFNNISGISWRSVLSVEEIGVPGDNHRPAPSHWQTLSYNVASSTPCQKNI